MKTKYCTKCKMVKSITEFAKAKGRKDRLNSWCKNCHKIYNKQITERLKEINKVYYQTNKEIILENAKKYRMKNKEQISHRGRIYYQNNRETIQEYNRKYYIKNRELILANVKEYYKENEDKTNATQREYYRDNKERIIESARLRYQNNEESRIKHKKVVDRRNRELGFVLLFKNPFPSDVEIDYHHINNLLVVPMPRLTHLRGSGGTNVIKHREKCNSLLNYLYGIDFDFLLQDEDNEVI